MVKLNVTFHSQWDTDATFSRDDCVACCCSMLLSYYEVTLTTDQIAKKVGTTGLVNFNQISTALASFGYKIIGNTGKTLDNLRRAINGGDPFLAIVHYGDLPNRQDTYKGGHAVVVVGYDDNNVYVNDPDFWGARREEGAGKSYPISAFNTAWQSKADGNASGNLWYLDMEKPTGGNLDAEEALLKELSEMRASRDKWKSKYEELDKETTADIQAKVKHIEELQKTIAEQNSQLTLASGSQESNVKEIEKLREELTFSKGEQEVLRAVIEGANKENKRLEQKISKIPSVECGFKRRLYCLFSGKGCSLR